MNDEFDDEFEAIKQLREAQEAFEKRQSDDTRTPVDEQLSR